MSPCGPVALVQEASPVGPLVLIYNSMYTEAFCYKMVAVTGRCPPYNRKVVIRVLFNSQEQNISNSVQSQKSMFFLFVLRL